MRKILLLCMVFAYLFPTLEIASASERSSGIENQASLSNVGEFQGPIQISSKIGSFRKEDNSWEVEIQSQLKLLTSISNDMVVTSQLFRVSDDKFFVKQVNDKNTLFKKPINHLIGTSWDEQLHDLTVGQYKLVYEYAFSPKRSQAYRNIEEFSFTITSGQVQEGWVDELPSAIPADISYSGSSNASEFIASNSRNTRTLKGDSQDTQGKRESTQPSLKNNGKDKITILGRWTSRDRMGKGVGVPNAKVEVRYRDLVDKWHLMYTTYTNKLGYYEVRMDPLESVSKWEIKVALENDFSRVENKSGEVWSSYIQYDALQSGLNYIWYWKIPESSTNEQAFWLYQDIAHTKDFLQMETKAKNKAVFVLNPASDEGAYYSPKTRKMYINATDSVSEDIPIHELGHFYMDFLYGFNFPIVDCESGTHMFAGTTEPGCGWTEGWASFLALAVNDDSVFHYGDRYTKHAILNSDNLEHTTGFDRNGDAVEGRVTAALWDLYDSKDDGLDKRNYPFKLIYDTMKSERIDNFAHFWFIWLKTTHDLESELSLNQNGIYYLRPELLRFGETLNVNVTNFKSIEFESITDEVIIQMENHSKNIVSLELFANNKLDQRNEVVYDGTVNGDLKQYILKVRPGYEYQLVLYNLSDHAWKANMSLELDDVCFRDCD